MNGSLVKALPKRIAVNKTKERIIASKHSSLIINDFCLRVRAKIGNKGIKGIINKRDGIDFITKRKSQSLVYKTNASFWLS